MVATLVSILVVLALTGWAIWGVLAWPKLKTELAAGDRTALLREYRLTIGGQLVLVALALAAAPIAGLTVFAADPKLGLGDRLPVGEMPPMLWGVLGAGVVGGLLGIVLGRRGGRQSMAGDIAAMIPTHRIERQWFVAVCLTVGVCEEVLYRGFMAAWLSDLGLNSTAVLILGSVFFGLAHLYQGWAGVAATTLMGAWFHVLYVASGALWIPMIAHALLDLRVLALPAPAQPRAG